MDTELEVFYRGWHLAKALWRPKKKCKAERSGHGGCENMTQNT